MSCDVNSFTVINDVMNFVFLMLHLLLLNLFYDMLSVACFDLMEICIESNKLF